MYAIRSYYAFFTAYLTEGEVMPAHAIAGYTIGTVVVLRIAWGFVGPTHARFRDFVQRPATTATYLRDLLRGRAGRFLGHNPAGGAMIVAMLVCLAITIV